MRHYFLLSLSVTALLFLSAASHLLAADQVTPKEVSKLFYDKLRTLKITGLPSGHGWAQLKPLLTEQLAAAIESAQLEQAEFMKKYPGEKPPWVDGDLFSSLFEGSTTHEVSAENIQGDEAEVVIHFTYDSEGSKTEWHDTMILKKADGTWLVADLKYEGEWDFASKGTLLQSLAPEHE